MAIPGFQKTPDCRRLGTFIVFITLTVLLFTGMSADRNREGEIHDGTSKSEKENFHNHHNDEGYKIPLQTQSWSQSESHSPGTLTVRTGFSDTHSGPNEPKQTSHGKMTPTSANRAHNVLRTIPDSFCIFSSVRSVMHAQPVQISRNNGLSKESGVVSSKTTAAVAHDSKALILLPSMKCITHANDMILPSKSIKDSFASNKIRNGALSALPDIARALVTAAAPSSTLLVLSTPSSVPIVTSNRSKKSSPKVLSKKGPSSAGFSVIKTLPTEGIDSKMLSFIHPSPVLTTNSCFDASSSVKTQALQSPETSAYSDCSPTVMISSVHSSQSLLSSHSKPAQESGTTVRARSLSRSRRNISSTPSLVSPGGRISPYEHLFEDASVLRLKTSTRNSTNSGQFLLGFDPVCNLKDKSIVDVREGAVIVSIEHLHYQKPAALFCRIFVVSKDNKPLTLTVIAEQSCSSPEYRSFVRVHDCEYSGIAHSCDANLCNRREIPIIYSQKSCLQFLLFYPIHTPRFNLNFSSATQMPSIKIEYVTENSGFVLSPLFNDNELCLLPLNFSTELAVPPGNIVFLSIDMIDPRDGQCLIILESGKDLQRDNGPDLEDDGSWSSCAHYSVYAKAFRSSLNILFQARISNSRLTTTTYGFKINFSFHSVAEIPQLLESGFFDCSTELYGNVRRHLECNLRAECQEEEDETNCPLSSSLCGSGFEVDGQCYKYWVLPYMLTWNEAHVHCRSRSGRLIILSKLSQLDNFTAALKSHNIHIRTYIGLKTASVQSSAYRNILQWYNSKITYNFFFPGQVPNPSCVVMEVQNDVHYMMSRCDFNQTNHIICQFDVSANETKNLKAEQKLLPVLDVRTALDLLRNVRAERCSRNYIVLDFLMCDPIEDCGRVQSGKSCRTSRGGNFPMFVCDDGFQAISFTSVCDHYSHCQDKSDELFCDFPACSEFACHNGQCVSHIHVCDGMAHCLDQSDEDPYHCMVLPSYMEVISVPDSFLINQTGLGSFSYYPWNASLACPTTHFRCLLSHCLPVYLLCNGIEDCPSGEDEEDCDNFVCPGFYKCQRSKTCLHPSHVCDGAGQCPFHDDELYCGQQCPLSCRCQGLAFTCRNVFMANEFDKLRFLDASGSGMTPSQLSSNILLVYLSLRNCKISELRAVCLPNLRELDLSYNNLTSLALEAFDHLTNLKTLCLSWNPLTLPLAHQSKHRSINFALKTLVFAGFAHKVFQVKFLSNFPGIEHLNLSHGLIQSIDSFSPLAELEMLDITGNPVNSFPRNVFEDLKKLKYIYTDNYKMCCKSILPQTFNKNQCYARQDEIASCNNLLRSSIYRVSLWLLSLAAIAGNSLTFAYRVCRDKRLAKTGFGIFVTNLSVSDFLMGVYLALIGAADQVYLGTYSQKDITWRESWVCKMAGFLSLLSSEVSALTICLITLDRFIVLRFPFSLRHFKARSAAMACGLVWLTGLTLATAPLLPVTHYWDFYSQNSICIPLPITRSKFHGQIYSFSIMIVLNSVLFMLIAAGQIAIFCSIRTNSLTINDKNRKSRDMLIAKRLAFVVVSDFMCWFPVGLLGILTAQGFSVPTEISVAIGIFVLPVNSALNPFLYTLNTVMEQRREKAEQKLAKELETRIRTELTRDLQARYSNRIKTRLLSESGFDLRQILDTVESNRLSRTDLELIAQKIKVQQAAYIYNVEQEIVDL